MQLHVLASGSPYVLPSFGQSQYGTVWLSSLNRAATHTVELAQRKGLPIEKFVLHDMRRTVSTHLHEAGYNFDWIEKALAMNKEALELYIIKQNMHSNEVNYFKTELIWLMSGLTNIINNKRIRVIICYNVKSAIPEGMVFYLKKAFKKVLSYS